MPTDNRLAEFVTAERLMPKLLRACRRLLPKGWGVTILAFSMERSNYDAHYISMADRRDMIAYFRETADRLERRLDRRPGAGN